MTRTTTSIRRRRRSRGCARPSPAPSRSAMRRSASTTASSRTTTCASSCKKSPTSWSPRWCCASLSPRRRRVWYGFRVADDWRLTATLKPDRIRQLLQRLREHEVEDDARDRLGGTVAVSAEGDNVYAYADSPEAVHEAERIIAELIRERGLEAETAIHRWHEL